ncbi:MAG: TonB-dependent receptor [Moraxellaceae bacterium]|jgi:iron complex outermembrane receptor protein|nr:TonB-dependent receptor [Moraxellaceae bacterium]
MRTSKVRNLALLAALAGPAFPVFAGEDLFNLALEDLVALDVQIATGTPKPLAEAPAVTSVITASELESIGAQDIGDALEAVPGLHVANGSFLYAPRYFIRGIVSTYNPHTLILVNGVPQTSMFLGDRGERLPGLYSLPVKLLDRIEIIRGPGSALYGADAFAGVINLITKSPLDVKGGQFSASGGSFSTQRGTLLQGGTLGEVHGLLSLSAVRTKGDRNAIITRDAQTNIDALAGTSASLAPGAAETGVKDFDARADLAWGDYHLRFGWSQAWEAGTGQGINDALDPSSTFDYHRGNLDFSWRNTDLFRAWTLEARTSYLYSDFRNGGINLFPPGAIHPGFTAGVQGRPNLSEENARADFSTLYTGRPNHRLRLGAGFLWADIFKTTDVNNYLVTGAGLVPRVSPVDVSDTAAVFQPENQRTSSYVFAQNEWAFTHGWELTAGLRFDDYSDVGSTTNPRLSLVWNTTPSLTSKLIYGEAFRAPAFFELYGTSNPVALGNADLEPEKLRSLELALGWKPSSDLTWDINLYRLRIRDFIDFENDTGQPTFTARNTARIRGEGLETELRQRLGASLQLLANYSRQRTRDQNGAALGLAPREEGHLRATWLASPRWQLSSQLNWIGERERQAGDSRPSLPGYATADLSLRRLVQDNLDLTLIARNLFDADIREPGRGPGPGQAQANLQDDLPQAGRFLAMEASLRW